MKYTPDELALNEAWKSPVEELRAMVMFVKVLCVLSLFWRMTVCTSVAFSVTLAMSVMLMFGSRPSALPGSVARLAKPGAEVSTVKARLPLVFAFPEGSVQFTYQECAPSGMPATLLTVAVPFCVLAFVELTASSSTREQLIV